ncbi:MULTISPECIES: hypothetical protein [unclassified Saccharibacter]|uniref:hypothetical protein n=1 Tax=unclassified Saccharibacter TaxID=2648722 RepID=UPI001328B98B|nr:MULTISPECIES: hypothetical protein [unclassified Saccharibacter]MXV35963.1 hypothetical protein [Saccharibacter sp. EH611]MXV58918.1 hypothetical protein [Saccharibacter sp. EH70]MXV65887.1 hypothetical protein [Saccharibacter sp. EH60]
MYGAITGKIALTLVIVVLCAVRIGMLVYAHKRGGHAPQGIVALIVRVAIPVLVAFLLWKVLWH